MQYIPPADFFLGPEDVVEISVWGNQDLSREVTVRPDGFISIPLIGDVLAADSTAEELSDRIAYRLEDYLTNPNVSVHLREANSYFFFVLGEVNNPGKFQVKSYASVLQGISMAGGFTPFAARNKIQIIRLDKSKKRHETQIRIPLNYDRVILGKGPPGDFILQSGDTIVVP